MTIDPAAARHEHASPDRSWEHIPDTFGSIEDISDTLITREQSDFLLTDANGNIPPGNNRGLGLYSRDTRYLSAYDFYLNGAYPLVLLSTADSGYTNEQVLGNHRYTQADQVIGRCMLEVQRQRVLNKGLEERVRVTNYCTDPTSVSLSYHFNADFCDIFEIRGHKRRQEGTHSTPEVTDRSIRYRYLGLDGVWRVTQILFDEAPAEISATGASFELTLGPRETRELHFRISLDEAPVSAYGENLRRLRSDYTSWRQEFAHIHTDNEVFSQVLDRSLTDLRMLWTKDELGHAFLAAGTPWFSALFGRDSIISSLQTLTFRPDIARECLSLLARYQGQIVDPYRCEEPGKILHEMRKGELARIGELPYERYYGSVDSTPLFLLLAAEYFHWTGDAEFIETLMPAVHAGLRWVFDYGIREGRRFVEYDTDSADGLRNQGWKDSVEGLVHADGGLCDGPIALAEVQGYTYLALQRLAPVFDALDEPRYAADLRSRAEELSLQFCDAFWLPDLQRVAMALDGEGHPSKVMSSNAGQVLWSGLLGSSEAAGVREALFRNDMFTGWGIRTLSSDATSFYPLGYHVGTVWPHDNGIIAHGLKRYGFDDEVNEITTSLYDAARQFPSYRLPELFGGQARSEYQPPVPYPVACRPQAWTAGSLLHLLQAMLGLHADACAQRLWIVRPKLPSWLEDLHIIGLPFAQGSVDLHFKSRQGKTFVNFETHGDLDVRVSTRSTAPFRF